ncbi:zinc metalloproteinase nas-15-like [Tubulanus polymorphus]|uniref:zinc metalloproteinase nas-15-like n=1 Tax=Tubulanus polymorphus TaxID=672921 RepID=UPI003DA2C279
MSGGVQAINLHPNCRIKPTILHEFGHALGLVHEHQLPDRDEYLNILYENVEPDWAIWFKRIESNLILQYEVPYDYRSIMHYGITAFSANGKQTIQAKDITKGHLIQDTWDKASFSFSDVKVINSHYECSSHCPETVKNKCPQPDSFLNKNCRCEFAYGKETDPQTEAAIVEAGPTTVVPCVDRNVFCQELARGGACNTDPGYMLQNCQVSCGICSLTSSSSPTQPTTTGPMPCLDLENQCALWASQGYCEGAYATYVHFHCKKSCDLCSTSSTTTTTTTPEPTTTQIVPCADNNVKCATWAGDGNCVGEYEGYMRDHCRDSCGICSPTTTTTTPKPTTTTTTPKPTTTTVTCVDNNGNCKTWADDGYCVGEYEGYMRDHCSDSCGICSPTTTTTIPKPTTTVACLDHNDNCQIWADEGHCVGEYEPYMSANCRKACSTCPTIA